MSDSFSERHPELNATGGAGDPFAERHPGLASQRPSALSPASAGANEAESFATTGQRFEAGMKVTAAGKLNYLREKFGADNVRVDDASQAIYIRNPATGEVRPLDPSPQGGLSWQGLKSWLADLPGDVADVGGDLLEGAVGTAPALEGAAYGAALGSVVPAVGTAAGGLLGLAAGSMVGGTAANAARQAGSATLPGSDELGAAQRAGMASTAGVAAAAGEGVGRGVTSAAKWVTHPHNWLRKLLGEGVDPAVRVEGERLAAKTGVDLTYGQMTGGRTALRIEGTLAQREASGDVMFGAALKQARQFQAAADKIIDSQGGPVTSADAGKRIGTVFGSGLRLMKEGRRAAAAKNYGDVDKLAGGQPVILIQPLLESLNSARLKYAALMTPDKAQSLADTLGKSIGPIVENGRAHLVAEALQRGASKAEIRRIQQAPWWELKGMRVSVTPFQNTMSTYKQRIREAFGANPVLADPGLHAKIEVETLQAMRDSLADTAGLKGVNAKVVKALQAANDQYRLMSQEIDSAQNKLLVKALKLNTDQAPDVALQSFLSTASDSQVRGALGVLGKMEPAALPPVRAALLGEIFGATERGTGPMAVRNLKMSPAQFATFATKNKGRIQAIFEGDPKALAAIGRLVKVARRIGDQAGVAPGGAQTQLLGWFGSTIDIAVTMGPSPKAAAEKAITIFNSKNLATILSTRQGVEDFLHIIETKQWKQEAAGALGRVLAIIGRDDGDEQPQPNAAQQAQ